MSAVFIRTETLPARQAPFAATGPWGWLSQRLFATPGDIAMTVIGFAAFVLIALPLFRFLAFDAVWTGQNRDACVNAAGACWPFVWAKLNQFIYGFYPHDELWRPNLVFAAGALLLLPLLIPSAPFKRLNAILFFAVYPVVGFVLLTGGNLDAQRFVIGRFVSIPELLDRGTIGLPEYLALGSQWGFRTVFWIDYVASALLLTAVFALIARIFGWGGLLVTLVVAITGIVACAAAWHPAGARPPLEDAWSCFSASLHRVLARRAADHRAVHGDLHAAAVPARPACKHRQAPARADRRRAVLGRLHGGSHRGGLQAVPKGQYEGAWRSAWLLADDDLIIMPQALKLVIPGIVNTFIGLFKDTTLVRSSRSSICSGMRSGLRGPELGDADHALHRLCLRGHHLFRLLLRHVALLALHRAAPRLE
jgi:general L-amino acid transport system permease protein